MANLKDFAEEIDMPVEDILKNENGELEAFYDTYNQDVAFKYEDTIEALINRVGEDDFYKLFDDALERISNYEENEAFNIETSDGTKKHYLHE